MSMERERWVYVVYGHFDCDCSPSCPTGGVHIWGVYGSEKEAMREKLSDPDLVIEGHRFNTRARPGHKKPGSATAKLTIG
jgi:hypothetical protein